jgi:pimeloyl-ACP methyl ester carboxylesterase
MCAAPLLVTTADRVNISLDLYRGVDREAVVIVCPGFFQSKRTLTFRRLSEALAVDRDVLAMDFRGHGYSGGLFTFSAREGADLQAVLDWATPRYPRIDLIGFSLGGAIAINVLAQRRAAVRSLVAVSAPDCFERIELRFWTAAAMRTGLRGLELGAGCRPGSPLLPKERPIDNVSLLAGLPILFIHGLQDPIVSDQHSFRLHAAAGAPKRLETVAGGGHAEALFRDNPTQFMDLVGPWLAPNLSD